MKRLISLSIAFLIISIGFAQENKVEPTKNDTLFGIYNDTKEATKVIYNDTKESLVQVYDDVKTGTSIIYEDSKKAIETFYNSLKNNDIGLA